MEGTALSLAASPGNPGSDSDTICPVNPLSGPVSSARECLGLWVSWCHFNLLQLPGDQFAAFVIFWLSHPILFFLLFLAVRSLKFNLVYYLGTSWGRSWDNHSWVQSTKLPGPRYVCARAGTPGHTWAQVTHTWVCEGYYLGEMSPRWMDLFCRSCRNQDRCPAPVSEASGGWWVKNFLLFVSVLGYSNTFSWQILDPPVSSSQTEVCEPEPPLYTRVGLCDLSFLFLLLPFKWMMLLLSDGSSAPIVLHCYCLCNFLHWFP